MSSVVFCMYIVRGATNASRNKVKEVKRVTWDRIISTDMYNSCTTTIVDLAHYSKFLFVAEYLNASLTQKINGPDLKRWKKKPTNYQK